MPRLKKQTNIFVNMEITPFGSIEGPWNIGDPVHEVLTLLTIDAVKSNQSHPLIDDVPVGLISEDSATDHNIAPEKTDVSVHQFIRGIVWPDDPRGFLFDDHTTLDYSTGYYWYTEFSSGSPHDPEKLIARSHRGDLQFFHSMASVEGEDTYLTLENIMAWSHVCIDLLRGNQDPSKLVQDNKFLSKMFPANRNIPIRELFLGGDLNILQFQQRICGVFLHMIQDSYFFGHVVRNPDNKIKQFRAYQNQDASEHKKYDNWWDGGNLRNRIDNTPGARNALSFGSNIFSAVLSNESTESVLNKMHDIVFKLA